MLPERLIDLAGLGDALQRRLTFTNGNALLKFAQIEEISPNRQSNDKNKQEEEGNAYARVGILIQRCFHNLVLTKQRVFTLLFVVWRSSTPRTPPPQAFHRIGRMGSWTTPERGVNGSSACSSIVIRPPHLNLCCLRHSARCFALEQIFRLHNPRAARLSQATGMTCISVRMNF